MSRNTSFLQLVENKYSLSMSVVEATGKWNNTSSHHFLCSTRSSRGPFFQGETRKIGSWYTFS